MFYCQVVGLSVCLSQSRHFQVHDVSAALIKTESDRGGMMQGVKEADRAALAGHLKALIDITTCHLDGGIAYARQIGMSLFEAFLDVEERFQRGTEATEQEIIDELRQVSKLDCLGLVLLADLLYFAC